MPNVKFSNYYLKFFMSLSECLYFGYGNCKLKYYRGKYFTVIFGINFICKCEFAKIFQ